MAENSTSHVFISYSRKDIDFARKLTEALKGQGLDSWIDWEGIPPTVDWWKEIEKGIEEADIFLFLISPDSVKSKVCKQEIEHAAKNGKHIIPIVVRDTSADEAPDEIRRLNWIFLRHSDEFDASFSKLMTAIKTDYEWAQTHRKLQLRALEWERNNKENRFLLRGKEIDDAQLLVMYGASKEPRTTELQITYVLASREYADRGVLGAFRRASRRQTSQTVISVDGQEIQPIEVGKLFSVSTDQASGSDQLN